MTKKEIILNRDMANGMKLEKGFWFNRRKQYVSQVLVEAAIDELMAQHADLTEIKITIEVKRCTCDD